MKENAPQFSVIVPIYNVKEYLRECIESIINQSYSNYELVLVDDGSTDGSEKIVDSYGRLPFVKIIHQKNQGLSAARNHGIREANGEYILFVDSDDYISEDALERFSECIMNNAAPDIIVAQAYVYTPSGDIYPKIANRKMIPGVLPGKDFWEQARKEEAVLACAPFNAYKKALIKKENIFFKEGLLHEDQLWTPKIFMAAQNVIDGDFLFYFHRVREDSITHTPNFEKRVHDIILICKELSEFYSNYPKSDVRWSCNDIATLYMSAVFMGEQEILKKESINRFFPIRHACGTKNILKAILFMISPKAYICIDKLAKKRL